MVRLLWFLFSDWPWLILSVISKFTENLKNYLPVFGLCWWMFHMHFEINVYSATVWCSVLWTSSRSNWLIKLFESSISLLIFKIYLSIKNWEGNVEISVIIVDFSISLFCCQFLIHVIWSFVTTSWWTDPFIIMKHPSLSLVLKIGQIPFPKVYFVWQ